MSVKTPGVPEYFSKVIDASEGLPSLEIFLYDFYKPLGVPGVPEYFSEVVKAPKCLRGHIKIIEKLF